MMANYNNRVLYTGMTSGLAHRVQQHKEKVFDGFTARYNCTKLVYYEEYEDVWDAIDREREIKRWRREKKNALVYSMNPQWRDLADDVWLM